MENQQTSNEAKLRTAAIVLAAGSGSRMKSTTKKQYMLIQDKPVLYYSLAVFQKSFIDEIVLVTSAEELSYCEEEIVQKYGFTKVKHMVVGGKERYHSVYAGIQALQNSDVVFIHDGARPMLSQEILERLLKDVKETGACVAGMKAKDTIKIADENGNIASTPNRNFVWTIQTPQVFSYELICRAYKELMENEENLLSQGIHVTDDAMVVEHFGRHPVHLVEGSYENIKITTPEDMMIARQFLAKAQE